MIETGDAIATFVDKISKAAESSALRDRDVLLARVRQDRPDAEVLDAADSRFYTETIKREQHRVDAQEVRRYFTFDRVRQGLLDVTGRLFGLATSAWTSRPGTPTSRRTTSRSAASGSAGSTSTCTRAPTSSATPPSSR